MVNVLYVDDDQSIHWIVEDALTSFGMKVFSAHDTAQAEILLKREKIDIVLCDMLMDTEDGLTFCKRLRRTGQHIPLILLSAGVDSRIEDLAQKAGATGTMGKPFEIDKLHQKILDTLAKGSP